MNRSRFGTLVTCSALAIAAAVVACTDSLVAPKQNAKAVNDNDPKSAAAGNDVMQMKLMVMGPSGAVEVPVRPAPARLVSNGVSEHWDAVGGFQIDSIRRPIKRNAPPRATPQGSASTQQQDGASFDATMSSRSLKWMRQTKQRLTDLGVQNGKHVSVITVWNQAASASEPPSMSVMFVDGHPLAAIRGEYTKHAGKWQRRAVTMNVFDSSGSTVMLARIDHRVGSKRTRVTSTVSVTRMIDAVATRIGEWLAPAELQAAEAAASDRCKEEYKWAVEMALAVVTAGGVSVGTLLICYFTDGVAWKECIIGLTSLPATATAVVAFGSAWWDYYSCTHGCGTEDRATTQAPQIAAFDRIRRGSKQGTAPPLTVDISHFNRAGKWVKQSARLNPAF